MDRYSGIWDYFHNKRMGKEANRLEKEALSDPFLFEALEGLAGIDGDHEQIIAGLKQRIVRKARPRDKFVQRYGWIAAIVLMGITALWVFLHPVDSFDRFVVSNLEDTLWKAEVLPLAAIEKNKEEIKIGGLEKVIAVAEFAGKAIHLNTGNVMPKKPESKQKAIYEIVECQELGVEDSVLEKVETDTFPVADICRDNISASSGFKDSVFRENSVADLPMSIRDADKRKRTTHFSGKISRGERNLIRKMRAANHIVPMDFEHYVSDSLKYPEDARLQKIEGKVILSVHLNKKGHPSRIKLIQKLSRSCDREAIRLVEDYSGEWNAKSRDFIVTVTFQLKGKE